MRSCMRPHRLSYQTALMLVFGATLLVSDRPLVGATPGAEASERRASHPLDPALRIARTSLKHLQTNVRDYTALFEKRNRVDGELSEVQRSELKIRHRRMKDGKIVVPLSVYLNFLQPDSVKGREVIWVEGRNNGKLIAHEGGLRNVMNVTLDPNSYLAMRNQRYPITEIGIQKLTAQLIDAAERDRQHAECEVQLKKDVTFGDYVCSMIEVTHPVKRPHFDFYRARIYFSHELNMPVYYASWSWPNQTGKEPVLEEEYSYRNLKVNVGLDDQDFDVDNPNYRFW